MLDSDTKNMISVWIGTSNKTLDEFNKYTEGMEDSDSQCPAFADFGVSFIDSDYFVAFQTDNGEIVPVEVLAEEVGAHSNKVIKDIVKVAKEKGINEGNSLYYYSNATFYEENPGKLYNDLKFIGTFKAVSYTHLRAHETRHDLVCRLLLEKKENILSLIHI